MFITLSTAMVLTSDGGMVLTSDGGIVLTRDERKQAKLSPIAVTMRNGKTDKDDAYALRPRANNM